ncbi:MAG: trimeric intracellular cation channel family protein [Kofleriaceae bacterium]|nr:trimeric intracellular cation channel family protein [Kofleriaceae bacterium]
MKAAVLALDLVGTFVFAVSGAMAAVTRRLDFFGIMVLAFAAGNAGGITRDLLIDAVPPAAISDWRYMAVSLMAGILTFFWHRVIERLRSPVQIFDGAGLALFAVAGTEKALVFGLNPAIAAVLGMVTGIGGGIMRDVLLNDVPTVLRSEIYAIAALAGAAVVVIGRMLGLPWALVMVCGALLCFAIRIVAIRRSWRLPRASSSRQI